VATQNIAARRREAEQAERIVDEEVQAFEDWQRSLDLTPTLVALRERVRGVIMNELERTLPRLKSVSEAEQRTLNAMCEAMTNKLLHRPLMELKKGRDEPDGAVLVSSVRRLFDLDQKQEPTTAPEPRAALEPARETPGEGP
jgi:glutamyl-tRNA reductase